MVKRYKIYCFAVVFNLLCLNLSQAQTFDTPPAPAPVPAPVSAPKPAPAPAPAPVAAPAPAAGANSSPANSQNPFAPPGAVDPNAILNIEKATSGKYEEFQSICRSREYDKLQYQSKDLYNAKLKSLQDKTASVIGGKISNTTEIFSLVKELIENQSSSDVAKLFSFLRQKKLNSAETNELNGFVSYSKRNYREAIANFQKYLDSDGDAHDEFVLVTMAEIYALENNFFEASAIYEDLNKQQKNRYLPQLCEAMVLNSLNADGETVCLDAATKFPNDPYPLIYAGITFRERENLKRARDLFRRANNLKQTEMGNVCIAELSMMENKLDDAVKYFKLSVTQSPLSARAVLGLAWAQIKALNYNDALVTFKAACKLNPKYEVEVRKAYKKLNDDKLPVAEKFMKVASDCEIL